MSSDSPKKYQFMVYAPDLTDEGAFQRRLSAREKHLEGVKELRASGTIKFGGALLSPESIVTADAPKKMVGSMIVYEASSIKEVEEILKNDMFYKGAVWDLEKIIILPILAAPL